MRFVQIPEIEVVQSRLAASETAPPSLAVETLALGATSGGSTMLSIVVPRMQLRESPVVVRSLLTAWAQTLNALPLICAIWEPRVHRKSQLRAAELVCVASPLSTLDGALPALDAENVPLPELLCTLKPPRVPLGFVELTLTRKR